MPDTPGLINENASAALREASLNLLVQERIALTVNAKNGLIASINNRFLETTDRTLPDITGQRIEDEGRLLPHIDLHRIVTSGVS